MTPIPNNAKFYLVSIMVSKPVSDILDLPMISGLDLNSGSPEHLQHFPLLCMADSQEAAAEQIKKFAFNKWPKAGGWVIYHATLIPITAEILALLRTFQEVISANNLANEDLISFFDLTDEKVQHFSFDQE